MKPITPVSTTSSPAAPSPTPTLWSRPAARVTTMVLAGVAVMLAANSAASALDDPVAALLIGPALAALVLWLYAVAVRRIERRPVTELARPRAGRRLLLGALGGFALFAIAVGIIALAGGYQVTGWGTLAGALTVVGMMCAIAVAEEVLFRGIIFGLIQGRWGTWIALVASALLFGLLHLINPGATLWGALAVAIEAGLMLGAAFVATGSLWLPIGLHLGWNITIVAVFGAVTSGSSASGALLQAVTPGPVWLTGGSFGPEGSLVSVAVCSVATVLLLVWAHRNGRIVPRAPRRSAAS